MEVRTQEIIRYIDLRFKEQDLTELREEISIIESAFKSSYHDHSKVDGMQKLLEFKSLITRAINEMRS